MKIGALPIIILGIALSLVALSFGYFHYYSPKMTEAQYQIDLARARKAQADLMPKAEERVVEADRLLRESNAKWQSIVARKTPPGNLVQGGIDLSVNPWQLTVDAPKFRNSIQTAIDRQMKKGGVKVISGGSMVPLPPEEASSVMSGFFNYPAIAFPVVIVDVGQVTVQGTYEQICNNIRSWSNMPNYLAVADGLQFEGTSPLLTGTYNLVVVAYVRTNSLFGDVNEGAGGGSSSSGGNMMSGLPGNASNPYMGGPPNKPMTSSTKGTSAGGGGGASSVAPTMD